MARPPRTEPPKLLTELELELMSILWTLGEGTTRQVLDGLPPERSLALTTVSTVLRVLEKKELVTTRKLGRAHVYLPAVSKTEYERRSLRDLTEKVFDRQPAALVKSLVEAGDLSKGDLADLARYLEEKLR